MKSQMNRKANWIGRWYYRIVLAMVISIASFGIVGILFGEGILK